MATLTNELIAIDCVTVLFWDYTSEDIEALRCNENFDYVWDTYVKGKDGEAAYQELWRCWMLKFSTETKQVIIDYAVSRFGQEKREGLEFEVKLKEMAKRQRDK